VDHAGKTTVLEQMKGLFTKVEPLAPDKIPPTVGLNIGRMEVGRVKLIFWDLGGQTGLRGIWEKYYAEVHGLVYVIDASDEKRFEESRSIFEVRAARVRARAPHEPIAEAARARARSRAVCAQGLVRHPELEGVPILVLANKQDLRAAATVEDVEERFGFGSLCTTNQNFRVEAVSALTGSGVADGVAWLVETLKRSSRGVAHSG
jgi:ADP-ribosylation factor related protein 1